MTDSELFKVEFEDGTPIHVTYFGSHLYGTNTKNSDVDIRGVFVPRANHIIMNSQKDVFRANSKDDPTAKNCPDDIDFEMIAMRRVIQNIAKGDPGALDLLFSTPLVKEGAIFGTTTGEWDFIWENRDLLLSRRIGAFSGYCMKQVAKYGIKGSRVQAAEKALHLMRQAERSLGPKAKVMKLEEQWESELSDNEHCWIVERKGHKHFECCNKLVPFTASIETAISIFDMLVKAYGERARKARDNEGVDWKAVSHAQRVLEQGIELLATGEITFPRPNAEELIQVKEGMLPFASVQTKLDGLLERFKRVQHRSSLPNEPARYAVERLVGTIYGHSVQAFYKACRLSAQEPSEEAGSADGLKPGRRLHS